MYSVGRHSRRSSSSRNRTGKPYASHLARLDYLLIYLPTQVQLTLMKIIKIVATRWRILRLKCTIIRFRLGLCPRPYWGSLQRSPRPLSWIWGALLLRGGAGRGREEREGEGGGEGKGHEPPTIWRKFTPMTTNKTILMQIGMWFVGKGMKGSTSGGRRTKLNVTWGRS